MHWNIDGCSTHPLCHCKIIFQKFIHTKFKYIEDYFTIFNQKNQNMKKISLLVVAVLLLQYANVSAQGKFFTREGKVHFFSKAPMEEIDGVNKKATSIIDTQTGQIEFSILMKAFEFEKALMMEHFNENYVESDKFPKSVFKGVISNNSEVKWTTDGTYPVKVAGKMTLHGVTKDMNADGTITIKGGKPTATSTFNLLIKDYNIEIPKVVKDKVAESVKVVVDISYEPFQAK